MNNVTVTPFLLVHDHQYYTSIFGDRIRFMDQTKDYIYFITGSDTNYQIEFNCKPGIPLKPTNARGLNSKMGNYIGKIANIA